MTENCSQFEGIDGCFGWNLCVEVENTNQPDFPEGYPFSDSELYVWLEYRSEFAETETILNTGKLFQTTSKTIRITDSGCRSVVDQFNESTAGFGFEAEQTYRQIAPATDETDEINSKNISREIIIADHGGFFDVREEEEGETYKRARKFTAGYRIEASLYHDQLVYGGQVTYFSGNNFQGMIGTKAAIEHLVEGGTYSSRYFGGTAYNQKIWLNEDKVTESTKQQFITPYLYTIKRTQSELYRREFFKFELCPGGINYSGLPESGIGDIEGNTIQFCPRSSDKKLIWSQVSCNTIGAYFKGESPSQLRLKFKLFDRCHFQRIKSFRAIYKEKPCSQIIIRRKAKTYKLAAIRMRIEKISQYTIGIGIIGTTFIKNIWLAFPGRWINYSDYVAIDKRTFIFQRLLGQKIELFDKEGRPFITTSNINGLLQGSQGKVDLRGNWALTVLFPVTRVTINWKNFTHGDRFNPPEGAEIHYFSPDSQPSIFYEDQNIIPIISGGFGEINPDSAWEDISSEDFKIIDVDGHISRVELEDWKPISGTYNLEEQRIAFIKENGQTAYWDILKRGSLDKRIYSVDEYEYNNDYCSIFKKKEEDFMADAEEIKELILENKRKLEDICDRVESIEGVIDSISFPATLWEVPSTGLGDPKLGTINNYSSSRQGLQNTINQLALVIQGLGRTAAHNKTVTSDIGMAIGVKEWRKKYGEPEPAEVPGSLIKEDGEEAEPIKVNNLTELFRWYIEQFDALMGEFSIQLDVADADPLQGGNQVEKLQFLNLAETLAEMLSINLNASLNSDLLVHMASKDMVEMGQVKKMAIVNHSYLQSIADYLGFESETKEKKVPFAFKPNAKSLAELIKPGKCPVEVVKFSGKDNLQVALLNLLHASAASRSNNWRTLRNLGDATSMALQMKDIIRGFNSNTEALTDKEELRKFEKFTKEVEAGFKGEEGIRSSIWGDEENAPEINIIKDREEEE